MMPTNMIVCILIGAEAGSNTYITWKKKKKHYYMHAVQLYCR